MQLAAGSTEVRLGDLTPTRDFTFVEDTCCGLLALAGLDDGPGDVFNIGSNDEVAIGDLVTLIGRVMDVPVVAITDAGRLRPPASEVSRLRCDNAKLERAAAFRPRVPLADGIARTAQWFRDPANLRRYKTDLYSV